MKACIGRSRVMLSAAVIMGFFLGGWVEMSPAAGSASSQPLAPPVGGMCENDQAPIGCWRMEEGTGSVIFDGGTFPHNDGSLINNVGFFDLGKIGKWALDFTSWRSQYVTIPDSDDLDIPGPLTISVWFRPIYPDPDPSPVEQVILQKYDGNNGFELYFTTTHKIKFRINGIEGSRVLSSTIFERSKWAHVLITYDKSQISLYINGSLQSTSAETKAIGANPVALTVGAAIVPPQVLPQRLFNGQIDDIRIYGNQLSYTDIQDLVDVPGSPQTLTIEQRGQGVYLSWSPNSGRSPVGYNVYRSPTSTVPMTDPLNNQLLVSNTNYLDESPIQNSPNYYIVTALDKFRIESFPSDVVSLTPTAVTTTDFAATTASDTATLTWQTASEVGVYGFNLYRSASIDGQRELRGSLPTLFPGQVSHAEHVYTFTESLPPGEAWYYWLEVEGPGDWLGPIGPLALQYRVVLPLLVR